MKMLKSFLTYFVTIFCACMIALAAGFVYFLVTENHEGAVAIMVFGSVLLSVWLGVYDR